MVKNTKNSKEWTLLKKKKFKTICEIIILLIVLIIGCFIFLRIQKFIFFHPWNDVSSYNQLKTISDFEEVNIISDDKNLN